MENDQEIIDNLEMIYLYAYGGLTNCQMYLGKAKDAEDYKYRIVDTLKDFQKNQLPQLLEYAEEVKPFYKVLFPELINVDLLGIGVVGFTPETTSPPTWNVELIAEVFRTYANIANLMSHHLAERKNLHEKIRGLESDSRGLNNTLGNAHALIKRSKRTTKSSISEGDLKDLIDTNRFPTSGAVNLTKLGKALGGVSKDTAKKIIQRFNLSRYAKIN